MKLDQEGVTPRPNPIAAMPYDEEISSFPVGPLKLPIDDRVDILHSRFPLCIVWTPLPIVSWLAPFVGHVGVCCEDGSILDFSGSCLVNFDKFAFGTPARYSHLDREKVIMFSWLLLNVKFFFLFIWGGDLTKKCHPCWVLFLRSVGLKHITTGSS